jgi:hypothetical protein
MRGVQASSFTPNCLGCLELADDPAVAVPTFAQLGCVAADLTLCRSDRNEDSRDKQQDVLHFRHSR